MSRQMAIKLGRRHKDGDMTSEHGVDFAGYGGGSGEPYYQPVMQCLCGYSTGRQESWEDCGRMFDEHLTEDKR